MPQVICTLENASNEINGVKFELTEGGMLSEEIADETAQYFCQIPGYALKDDGAAVRAAAEADAAAQAQAEADAKAKADADAKAAADAASDQSVRDAAAKASKDAADAAAIASEVAAKEAVDLSVLVLRAGELGIEVKSTWKAARLTAEVKRAEEAKAAADAAGQ